MQDSEEHSPIEQPARSRAHDNGYLADDSLATEEDVDQRSESDRVLPPNGLRFALITGAIAGALGFLLQAAITIVNTPIFQKSVSEGKTATYSTSLALAGLQCLDLLLSLAVCFIIGFIVGRVVVQRRLGFIAGALSGAVLYLGGFLANYIPGYPGRLATNTSPDVGSLIGGLLLSLIFLLIWCGIGGLMGLWGASTATRKHPNYAH